MKSRNKLLSAISVTNEGGQEVILHLVNIYNDYAYILLPVDLAYKFIGLKNPLFVKNLEQLMYE